MKKSKRKENFLTKCPACGNKDVKPADPMHCPKCKVNPPVAMSWKTSYWRNVNDAVAVAIHPDDLPTLFPGRF